MAGASAVLASGGGVAYAQDSSQANGAQVQEIIVTASKTGASSIQKTPIAVTAISSKQVGQQLLIDARDLERVVPDVSIGQNNAFAEIYIRGIGSNNTFNGSDPDVTVQVDGVYIARPFGQFTNFLDVDRVEVLRGPQGTLYGRNAVGGTINVISQLPSDTFVAKADVGTGNANLFQGDGYVSGPIIAGRLDGSIALNYTRHDPYIENVVPGVGGIDSANRGTVHAQLLAHITDNFQAITRADVSSEADAVPGFDTPLAPYDPVIDSILGQYDKVALNLPTLAVVQASGISEELDDQVLPNLLLKSITAFRDNNLKDSTDSDGTDKNLLHTLLREGDQTFSEEFSGSGRLGRLDYVGGLYYGYETDNSNSAITNYGAGVQEDLLPKSVDDNFAAFAQADYHVTDQLTLTAGVRDTTEHKTFDQNLDVTSLATGLPTPGHPVIYAAAKTWDAVTPKFSVSYTIPNAMLYASATQGFKSGGFNFTSANSFQGFAPEYLWSFETGLKTDLFDRHLRFNVTAFYYDYTNLQVQAFILPGVADITNAATATVKGIEFETELRPVEHLDIGANLSFLDGQYDHYIGSANINYSGKYLNDAPKYTLNSYAEYGWEVPKGLLSLRGEYSYIGTQYYTAANTAKQSQGAYSLVNAFLIYQPDNAHWKFELWAKNLSNTGYVTSTAEIGPIPVGTPGDPRTFGIKISWSN
jgi:iron complex outermembrane receptor protein